MNKYDVVLALHILAAIFGFGVAAVAHSTMFRLRVAGDIREARGHLRVLDRTGPLFPVAAIALFVLGAVLLSLADDADGFDWGDGWVVTAIVALVVVEAVGGLVIGRRVKTLSRALESVPDGPLDAPTRTLLADRPVWLASHFTTAVIASVVFLMTGKPSGTTSVVIVVVGALVGLASAVPFSRPVAEGAVAAG